MQLDTTITIIAAFVLQVGSHYFPWHRFFSKNKLPRVAAYIVGVLFLFLPLTCWLLIRGFIETIWVMWGTAVAGGGAVVGFRALDKWLDTRDSLRETRQRENLLTEQRRGQDDD